MLAAPPATSDSPRASPVLFKAPLGTPMGSGSKWSLARLFYTSPLEVKNERRPRQRGLESRSSASQYIRPHSCLSSWLHRWPNQEAKKNEKLKKATETEDLHQNGKRDDAACTAALEAGRRGGATSSSSQRRSSAAGSLLRCTTDKSARRLGTAPRFEILSPAAGLQKKALRSRQRPRHDSRAKTARTERTRRST